MSDFLQRLIGSPSLHLGQPGVELGFERPIPAWAWALVALAAIALGFLAYRRTEGSQAGRVTLGALRSALLLLLALLIAGPRLIRPNETEEKDWVLVLVDRSASMAVADAPGGAPSGKHATREAQLRSVLSAAEPTFRALAAERAVVWLGFDAGAYDLPLAPDGRAAVPHLADPAGRRTDIDRAIDQALRRAAARPISGVVLMTDGRSASEPSRTLLRRLEAEKVPVFSVALGSPTGLADVALRRAEAPRYAFVKDAVPVEAELTRSGPAPARAEPSVVELIDAATGAVLDTRTVEWSADAGTANPDANPAGGPDAQPEATQRVTLTTRPTAGGQARWRVRVRPGPGSPGDMVEDNNASDLALELVDRPLRIAYFDGYPRWEYRYLKNLLVREGSASAAVMLLDPGKRYIQEGNVILDALPRSPEEWARFDVIVIGDVQPTVFAPGQLEQLKQRVAVGGAGLIWIGGESATPGAWRSTPLADLLPMTMPEAGLATMASGLEPVGAAVTMSATPAADRLGVLRLSDAPVVPPGAAPGTPPTYFPASLSSPTTGWSRLFWAQRIDPATVKPTAEVLATASPISPGGDSLTDQASPLLLSMRYGAGRIIYLGTDEIWRWRYGRGELLPERFWIQLVRLLGRESVARTGRPAILEVTPDRASVEQPVRVQVTLIDQSLLDTAPGSIRVRVARDAAAPDAAEAPTELTLTPEAPASAPGKGAGAGRVYAGTWIPAEAGRFRVVANDPALTATASADDLAVKVEVWQPDDEMRRPQTDHPLLAKLSDLTGGKTLAPDELAQLPKLLPNRRLKLAGEPEVHTLWDTPLALLLVVILLTAEWVGRRLLRLA